MQERSLLHCISSCYSFHEINPRIDLQEVINREPIYKSVLLAVLKARSREPIHKIYNWLSCLDSNTTHQVPFYHNLLEYSKYKLTTIKIAQHSRDQ